MKAPAPAVAVGGGCAVPGGVDGAVVAAAPGVVACVLGCDVDCGIPEEVSVGIRAGGAVCRGTTCGAITVAPAAPVAPVAPALGLTPTTAGADSGAEVTLVVPATEGLAPAPPVLSLVAAGSCVTGLITMVVAATGAAGAVACTTVTSAGSRCAWPRP